jgi:hypothetical protein
VVQAEKGAPVSGSVLRLHAAARTGAGAGHRGQALSSPATSRITTAREQERFWAWDFHKEQYYVVEATLRHVSPTSWIYSEDGAEVSGLAVARLAETFEDRVLPVLRDRYGSEPSPGVDGQAAVTLLLLDVRDDLYHEQAPYTYVSGYFDPANQAPATALVADTEPPESGAASNGREMVYLDIHPTDPEGPIVGQTVAHEFAHLIGWAYDPDEEAWLSEGLAQLAIHVSGLGHPSEQVRAFLADPETPLLDWQGEVRDYGKSYLWLLYLYEQFDGGEGGALAHWVRDPGNGMASLMAGVAAPRPPDALLRDFGMALHFDDSEHGDGRFGFRALEIDPRAAVDGPAFQPAAARRHAVNDGQGEPESESLAPWTVRADHFDAAGSQLEVALDPSGPACLGAGWRDAPGRGAADGFESTCMAAERPTSWLLRVSAGGGVRTVVAHVGEQPLELRALAAPLAATQSRGPRIYLPLTLRR